MFISISKLIITDQTANWCQLPYPNHPKGCPNFGRIGCPPTTKPIVEVVDLIFPVYFVYSEFNLEAHRVKMKKAHNNWSTKQLNNVLYWQGTSRKQLKERVKIVQKEKQTNLVLYCPEAHGVNVYATAFKNGLQLERIRSGLQICHHIALLGDKL